MPPGPHHRGTWHTGSFLSCVDLPGTDPHMLSGMTPGVYSRRCILPKTTINDSLASVRAQHMGLKVPGLK